MNPELLERYFQGRCSPSERREVERWLQSGEAAPDAVPEGEQAALREEIWAGVSRTALGQAATPAVRSGSGSGKGAWPHYYKLAAGLALFLCLGYVAQNRVTASRKTASEAPAQTRRVATTFGQKARLTLPDGTVVQLNAGSEITFPERFSASTRDIRLSGEACFHVAKDSVRPFTVHTRHAWTRVLGTVFNVRAYEREHSTTVAVREGKVGFAARAASDPTLLLTAGRMGRCDGDCEKVSSDTANAEDVMAWTENRLVFTNKPLSGIARDLERWYGIEVEIRPQALAAQRFTGRYDKPRLDRLLKGMAAATGFRYTLNGKRLLIED